MKIGIIQTRPGIGDFCIFLPLVHLISDHYKSSVTIITKKRSKGSELTFYDPHIKKVIYIRDNNNSFDFYKKIKKENFDAVFIFHYSFRYYLLCLIAGINKIFHYGFFKKNTRIFDHARSMLIQWLNITSKTKYKCKLFFYSLNKKNKKNIIIGIGGSGKNKKWNIENYKKIIKKINLSKYKIILAGGPSEKKEADIIKKEIKNKKIVSLCNMSLFKSIKFIVGSKLYVGNDTGFMHIASSLGIKSYGIFGDTPIDYCEYNPLITPITIQKNILFKKRDFIINQILPNRVFKFIKKHL